MCFGYIERALAASPAGQISVSGNSQDSATTAFVQRRKKQHHQGMAGQEEKLDADFKQPDPEVLAGAYRAAFWLKKAFQELTTSLP